MRDNEARMDVGGTGKLTGLVGQREGQRKIKVHWGLSIIYRTTGDGSGI